jgi:hypothetical protein
MQSIGSDGGRSNSGRNIPSKLCPPKLPPKLPLAVKAPGVPRPHILHALPTSLEPESQPVTVRERARGTPRDERMWCGVDACGTVKE